MVNTGEGIHDPTQDHGHVLDPLLDREETITRLLPHLLLANTKVAVGVQALVKDAHPLGQSNIVTV